MIHVSLHPAFAVKVDNRFSSLPTLCLLDEHTERRILLIHHTASGGTEKATNSGAPVDGIHYQTGQEMKVSCLNKNREVTVM